MAKRYENRTYNVSVVGLSGTEKEKGVVGIGKSCLCNRFMRPLADDYYTDHISVLSQNDFGGRVVNNDHFLYWGKVTKTTDEGVDYSFHVVEQTEFIDDSSFQPFKSGKTDPYFKRCASTKLSSAEKQMYICKNQLGLEHEYEERMLPEGKLSIDGFLCLFDVSAVRQRPLQAELDHTMLILTTLQKTKKPIVLVTTKNDEANEVHVREVERLLCRKEFKNAIPMVETSAHKNINIELAFCTLAHLLDNRTKNRPKTTPYNEAARARREILEVAVDAYQGLIRTHVTDYKALWNPVWRKLQNNSDYIHFVEVVGTDEARRMFRHHVMQLRDEYVRQRLESYLRKLELVLREFLPDLVTAADRSWPSTLRWLRRHDLFDRYFVILPEERRWCELEFLESNDEHIPFDLLEGNDAEAVYRNHVNALRAEYKRTELKKQFKQLLVDNHNVCPGKSLNEVAIFFLGRECFSSLSEEDKHDIYEQHQRELRELVKKDFQELLFEQAELFSKFNRVHVTSEDLSHINEQLSREVRYKALAKMEEERKVILLNHLGFMQRPSPDCCPFREHCKEFLIAGILSTKAHRPQSWSRSSQFQLDAIDNKLNLVILGNLGLADQLAQEIRMQCIDDEYTLDGDIYCLDYRPIAGDVGLPQNSFKTPNFLPHGCFCVYNCSESLEYIRCSLEKTLLSDLQRDDRLPFQGLPIVIVLAHDPEVTEKGLEWLREEGQSLADRLQCPFIDIPSSMMVNSSRHFHEDQIGLAMHNLVCSIKHRSSFVQPWQIAESIEPDIRILMCFMCGDAFKLELPLGPLLNHQCCYVSSDKFPNITLETYLGDSKRKVEVTVVSYHGASVLRDALYHGYILVYSARRKASLATLSAFVSMIPPVPVKVLAVTESGGATAFFSNDLTASLITEGNSLADRIRASFTTTGPNFQQQTASYTPFFKECWERKFDTESAYTFEDTAPTPVINHWKYCLPDRPPAALPKPTPPKRFDSFGVGKNSASNSQSAEDSDPIYDQPQFNTRYASDSEGERASSTSPPAVDTSPFGTMDTSGIYSEIGGGRDDDTEQLIKPSQVRTRRAVYAEHYRQSYPSMSSSLASSSYREDSTDTDSSIRSPKLHRAVEQLPSSSQGEPHYQFRKSNSMKLALKETEEGANTRLILSDVKKRLLKSSTLPSSATPPDVAMPTSSSRSKSLCRRSAGDFTGDDIKYQPLDGHRAPPTMPKPKKSLLPPKPLDAKKYKQVRKVLEKNIKHQSTQPLSAQMAPLAIPEPIEISEYAQVKDALSPVDQEENQYASVADALPEGKLHRIRSTFRKQNNHEAKGGSESDSESDREADRKEDIYSRVNRRPTPHKKKHKPRHSDSALPPALPQRHYMEDMRLLVQSDHLDRVRSHSPSEGSEGTGDEHPGFPKQRKRRSLKTKKKIQSDSALVISPPWSDSDMTMTTISKDQDSYDKDFNSSGRYEDEDSLDGGWMRKLRLKADKDPEKVKRKEEKRAKEEDKRRLKEEEKRQKEQQKMQRKQRKKDGRALSTNTPPQGGVGGLEDMAQSEENLVPYFVEKCATFIEEGGGGLQTEGIYRVPGNKAQVDLLFEKFKEDPSVDIGSLDIQVNAVATALKQFFSELAEPLVPSNLYDELVEAAGIPDKSTRLLSIRGVLKKLPQANRETLRFIIFHIHRVSEHFLETSMDSRNLAICWSPTLLRPPITSFELVTVTLKHLEEIVQMLIEQHGFFFSGENEV